MMKREKKKSIHPYQILWLLPIVFAIHNIEELPFLQGWANEILDDYPFLARLYDFKNLAIAMGLLTLTVSIVVWMEYKKRNRITLHFTVFCICLLLVNGLIHVGQFFVYRHYVPGLISAVVLMIPYMAYILYLFVKNNRIQMREIFVYLVFSVIAMNPLIIVFLLISSLLAG
ncbi:HXXEE domain-containing protein [Thermolongibacillus altinsuensis]